MKRTAVSVIDLGLNFPRGNLSVKTLQSKLFSLFSRKKTDTDFLALKNISFEVMEGEVLGIIGRNGVGKSTLLRVIAGIYAPDAGVVKIRGKAALLASVGVGFNRELTGRENIFLYGSIIGLKRGLIENKIDEIISFSELGDFIDAPLKTYSSGMKARLGFSVAANLDANILLIDEVFGVGDASFRERSKTKIFQMVREANRTVVIVTHSPSILRQLCDRVIIIDEGHIVATGQPEEMIETYDSMIADGDGLIRRNRNRDAVLGPAAIQRAVTLMKRGQYNDSRALLEANLTNGKNPDVVRFHLGQLAIETQDFVSACQYWTQIRLDNLPDNRKLKRIGTISKKYDLELAFQVASFSLARDPDQSWAWQILEQVVRDSKLDALLLSLPITAPLIFIENTKRSSTIARLAFNLNKFKISATFCKATNTSNSDKKLVDLEGRAWNRLKNHQEALRCWLELIERDIELDKNYDRAARAAYNLGNFQQCFELSTKLHAIKPKNNQHLILAARAVQNGKLVSEKKYIMLFLEKADRGSRDQLLNICKSYNELREHEYTESLLDLAMHDHPNDIEFNLLYGRFLLNSNSESAALEHFYRASEMEPDRSDIVIFLARTLRRLGKLNQAIAVLQAKNEAISSNLNVRILLGNILSEVEDWEESLVVWQKILNDFPERGDAILKIANCYLKLNQLSEAEKVLQGNITDGNDNFKGLTMLRQVYWKQSRHEDALEIFKRLLNLDMDNISLWKNVILLSKRLQKKNDVKLYLQKLTKYFSEKKHGDLKLSLLYESLSLEGEMRKALERFRANVGNNPNVILNAAKEFRDLDRADVAFLLADEVTSHNPKHRQAGLVMTEIFDHLHGAGLNENWLVKRFESGEKTSVSELVVQKMIQTTQRPESESKPLEHIAFVSHSVGIGGAERQIINTIKGFEKHVSPLPKITLFCSEWSDKDDKDSYRKFINESIVNLKTIVPKSSEMIESEEDLINKFGKNSLEQLPKNLLREIYGLYQQFKQEKPSVVHAFHDRLNIVAGIAAVLAQVPRIVLSTRSVSKHDVDDVNPFARPIWYKQAYKLLLGRPQVQMYHVSSAVSKSYDAWLELPQRQKLVIYNSTDYELMVKSSSESEFNLEKKGINLEKDNLLVGGIMRFSSEKRPLLFIETAKRVIEKLPNTKFILLGEGPLMKQATRTVRRLGLEENIHFIGRSHQIYLWLQKFDLLLLTSEFEGLPNVLIEAQGFGVPVISTNAGGASETFIEGQTGYLSQSGDEEDLAAKLVAALKDDAWRRNAKSLSKSNAKEKFSLETASSNFVSLYSSIDVDGKAPSLTSKPLDIPKESKLNLFTYVDDRNGKAALLCSAAKRLGIPSFMVRNSDLVPDKKSSFVYFFIDHLDHRDRDKLVAESFGELKNIKIAPSLQELRVYDDKGAQQIEYGMLMPPALYSSDKKAAEEYLKTTKYPFVSKAIEGAHASNVRLVENEDQARKELEAIFSEEGKARHDAHIPGLTQKGYVL